MEPWRDIYDFWFGPADSPERGAVREMWFGGGPEVDAEIRTRFAGDYERAAAGILDDWAAHREGAVARIVCLDQFPRNIFRGTAQAFAADPLALDAARALVDGPFHDDLMTVEKLFAYLPFEHSEDLADQDRSVALVKALEDHPDKQLWVDYAIEHRVIIEQFGRFPHRNAALGRPCTPEEEAWLASTDQRFGVTGPDDDPADVDTPDDTAR